LLSCASTPKPEDIKQAEAHNKIGYAYINKGQLNEASIEFQKALALNPENKETLYNLGYINHHFRKYPEAISYYERTLAIDPDYAEVINNLGVVYTEMGNWDEAIKYFNEALANPKYRTPAPAYSNLGYAYYKKGDFMNAESATRDALARNPIFPRALYILGMVYIETNREMEAIEEFKKAIGIQPDYMDAHWELAKTYLRRGRKAKALKHFKVVSEKDENRERSREARKYIEQLKY
jgi:type IV pilus biogenesis/stability protein PilW